MAHTLTGTVLGTPACMSYAQASGMKGDELDAFTRRASSPTKCPPAPCRIIPIHRWVTYENTCRTPRCRSALAFDRAEVDRRVEQFVRRLFPPSVQSAVVLRTNMRPP